MDTSISVLIVEDSEDDALLLLNELLRAGFDPIWRRVDTRAEMCAALNQGAWHLIICDYVMPSFNALEALQVLKESGLDVPFIVVSGKVGEDIAVEAMRAGAQDYLLKGNLVRLGAAVERELREAVLRREHKKAVHTIDRINQLYMRLR